jgi:light-regulated signal transduction histidine kinase (bacteriophytochrome)
MHNLINDLLAFSRVGARNKALVPTDTRELLEQALFNLRSAVEESGAAVTHDALPVVRGDAAVLVQLFQNLIGNAIKFRSSLPPEVHVGAERRGPMWEFVVSDNGLGIAPQYHELIFKVFQRLHTRDQHPGTGIGLALCRRVVDRHGGRIWVESKEGSGARFHFTLPAVVAERTGREETSARARSGT